MEAAASAQKRATDRRFIKDILLFVVGAVVFLGSLICLIVAWSGDKKLNTLQAVIYTLLLKGAMLCMIIGNRDITKMSINFKGVGLDIECNGVPENQNNANP